VLGMGESIAFPGSSKIICQHVPPERRGIANAAVATGIALGPAVGTLLGGLILIELGWRAIFVSFGLVTLIWLVPWQRVVNMLPARSEGTAEPIVPMRKLIGRWSLWAMSIGHAAGNYSFYFMLAFLPLYLVKERGFSIGQMTTVATLGYATQAVAALTLGTISDRWTQSGRSEAVMRRAMLVVSQAVAAACILGVAASRDIVTIAVLLCIAGAATASLSTNLYAVAQMFSGPRAAGTWVGVQNALGNVSGIVGPVVSGILIDHFGYDSAFALAAGVAAFGAIWWAFAIPHIRQVITDEY
jgi:MFS family permease